MTLIQKRYTAKKTPEPHYLFKSWKQHLLRVPFIIYRGKLKLYDAPNGNLTYHQTGNNQNHLFKIIDVDGEWAKLAPVSGIDPEPTDGNVNYSQWIKWHDGKGLNIQITEHIME